MSLPIIIHILMRRRRRPIAWGAMRFLLEAYRKQRRRLAIEQLLLLLARCALVALLAIAVGRLIFERPGERAGGVTRCIVIDNSLTSAVRLDDGRTALRGHVDRARALIESMDETRGDRVAIVLLGAPVEALVSPPTADLRGAARALDSIEATDSAMDLDAGLAMARELLDGAEGGAGERQEIVAMSQWREGSLAGAADLDGAAADGVLLIARPESTTPENIRVASVEPVRTVMLALGGVGASGVAGVGQVRVGLARSGGDLGERAVRVTLGLERERDRRGRIGDRTHERLALGGMTARFGVGEREIELSVPVTLQDLTPGAGSLVAEIDDDALGRDNRYRREIDLRRSIRVGIVGDRPADLGRRLEDFRPADWIALALSPVPGVARRTEIEIEGLAPLAVEASRLAGLDALVVTTPGLLPDASWAALRGFADRGGLLVVTPDDSMGSQGWVGRMTRALGLAWEGAWDVAAVEPPSLIEVARDDQSGLLRLLAGELEPLARTVVVERVLRVRAAQGRGALLRLTDGTDVLLADRPGGEAANAGLVVMLNIAASVDWSTLPAKPLMVPLMQEAIRQGVGLAQARWRVSAGAWPTLSPGVIELRPAEDGRATISVDDAARPRSALRVAGLWRAVDGAGLDRGLVVVNPSEEASRVEPTDESRVLAVAQARAEDVRWLDAPGEWASGETTARRGDPGRPGISLMLFAAALGLATLELGLARWVSHAGAGSGV
ncbi:MAG: BatA domain-containing protein [Phycisphaeraceae bacterium]|nr:BatA domain-containing protein [Phycisphaeraceae bacterium]